jgi:hypothetical protein
MIYISSNYPLHTRMLNLFSDIIIATYLSDEHQLPMEIVPISIVIMANVKGRSREGYWDT